MTPIRTLLNMVRKWGCWKKYTGNLKLEISHDAVGAGAANTSCNYSKLCLVVIL